MKRLEADSKFKKKKPKKGVKFAETFAKVIRKNLIRLSAKVNESGQAKIVKVSR